MMYSEEVISRFTNPKNVGLIKGASGVGVVGNATCGDIIKVYLKIEGNKIANAKFKTFGCAAAIASSDVAMDLIKDKTIDEALKITHQDVVNELGELPEQKIHCSLMAQDAIAAAVADYKKREEKKQKSTKD
ncbi:MAG: iron-sulfur cluster assembly scaffold protein [Clostridia bacterium]|nr:iron-sulfur cluster assembly scaffold protein [Clostridia bacterium]